MERRFINAVGIETRGDNKRVIRGLASPVYDGTPGTEYNLYDEVYERFAPNAFNDWLQQPRDVVALINHDANQVLGRTPNTLKVWTDQRGLHYEIDPPDTQAAHDLMVLLERGDIKGSSFAFKAEKVQWRQDNGKEIREIHKASLHDVSVVTSPAYAGAGAWLRSTGQAAFYFPVDHEARKAIEAERQEWLDEMETERRYARWEKIEKAMNK